MQFNLFETVSLLVDFPEEGLKKGDIGTIVMVYSDPQEGYEVEFVDENGKTISQIAIDPIYLNK